MSFFIRSAKKQGKKRKIQEKGNKIGKIKPLNNEISSDESEEERKPDDGYASSDHEEETAQEKKIRLAKKYLEEIEREEKLRTEVDEQGKSVSTRLREDVLEQAGRLHRKIADNYTLDKVSEFRYLKNGHHLSVTCIVVSPDNKSLFSASKDCSIVKWCFESAKKLKTVPGGKKGTEDKHIGHTGHIYALAISSDGKYLVSGCLNKLIHVWNPNTMEKMHTFKGHRGAISGLVFRRASHQLFSSSFDRSVKVWNLDEMSYVETLFGHQDAITAIDCMSRERAITSGGRDGTVRIWKIVEESQLVFQGNQMSIDCIKFINETHFVSAGEDGSIHLWAMFKKKPLAKCILAHNINGDPTWITSIATYKNTDLIASASRDGHIRIWKCREDFKSLDLLFSIPGITGFVNSMEFSQDGHYLIAAIGQEHKLGRWWRIKEAKNCILIIKLQ